MNAPAGRARNALIWILALAAVGVWIWFLLGNSAEQAIRKLYADDPQTQEEGRRRLRENPDRAEVVAALLKTVGSPSEAYGVRRQAAKLLDEFGRRADLESLIRTSGLTVRAPILAAFTTEGWFQDAVLGRPEFGIRDTLVEWLRRDGDRTRADAILLARAMADPSLADEIRPLLRRSTDPRTNREAERFVVEGALAAADEFKDCEALPSALEVARDDPDPRTRMRAIQTVHRLAFVSGTCPDAVPEDTMRDLLGDALDDPDSLLRQVAALELAKRASAVPPHRERLRSLLASTSEPEVVRRAALDALAAARDEAFLADLPSRFHDATLGVRSAAVKAATGWTAESNPFLGSLIGVVRNERESRVAWDLSRDLLRRALGGEKGVSGNLRAYEATDARRFQRFLDDLYEKGAGEGVTRHAYARAWFEAWLRKHIDDPELVAGIVVNNYDAFWQRADEGSLDTARTALDGVPEKHRAFFVNERAWLDAHR